MTQVSQSVACNGLHRLEQRCCRWLLMTRDRVESDDLRLTHEFLAIMLGARRASVTEVLRPLQEAGLVRSHRGRISILNREGMEGRACECYSVVQDEYERLLRQPDVKASRGMFALGHARDELSLPRRRRAPSDDSKDSPVSFKASRRGKRDKDMRRRTSRLSPAASVTDRFESRHRT